MIASGTATMSHGGDGLSLPDKLTRPDEIFMIVSIDGHHLCLVPQNHDPAISPRAPMTENDLAVRGRKDRCPLGRRNVNPIMPMPAMRLKIPSNRPL